MKHFYAFSAIITCITLSSCEAVAGIFKAGMGFGIFLVLVVIIGILILVFKKK